MSYRLVWAFLTLAVGTVEALGCGGGGASPGSERAHCYPNATCNQGLTCLSNFCVRVEADGGGGADGAPARDAMAEAGNPGPDAAGTKDGGGSSFDIAPHPPLPQLADLGGPVLAAPKVLPVLFGGEPQAADLRVFLAELANGSSWRAATSEYGVGALSILPAVTSTAATPPVWTDVDVQAAIVANTSGQPAAWGPPDPNTIYLFLMPSGASLSNQGFECCTDFGGYHDETAVGGTAIPYAVVCDCTDFFGPAWKPLEVRTVVMSQQLIDAATNPFPRSAPAIYQADQSNLVWTLMTGGEASDMCILNPDFAVFPAGARYAVHRSWSNAAARAGQNPCVPVPSPVPYFNSMPVLDLVWYGEVGYKTRGVQLAVGQTRTIDLNLFSAAATARAWGVEVFSYEDYYGGSPSLSFALDRTSGRNGDVLHLSITKLRANEFGEPFVVVSSYGVPADDDYQSNVALGLVTF